MGTTNRNILKSWFERGKKPLASQFADWIDSFWHKEEKLPISAVENLEIALNEKATNEITNNLNERITDLETNGSGSSVDLTNYLTKEDAENTYITSASASSTYIPKTNIVQSIGTNTAQIMSQKGATDLLFNGANKWRIQIGENAQSTGPSSSTAIGYYAKADGNATALGPYSTATSAYSLSLGYSSKCTGQFSTAVGYKSEALTTDVLTSEEYIGVISVGSNTIKRRIVNIKDGINDSDAATVAQLKGITGGSNNWFTTTVSTSLSTNTFTISTLTPTSVIPKINDYILSASGYTYIITSITSTTASANRSVNIKGEQGIAGNTAGIHKVVNDARSFFGLIAKGGGIEFVISFLPNIGGNIYSWMNFTNPSFPARQFTIYYDGISRALEATHENYGFSYDYEDTDLISFVQNTYGKALVPYSGYGNEKILYAIATVNIRPSLQDVEYQPNFNDMHFTKAIIDVKLEVPFMEDIILYSGMPPIIQLPRTIKCQFSIDSNNYSADANSLTPLEFFKIDYFN